MRIQEVKGRFSITIPVDVMKALNWHKGQEMIWLPHKPDAILSPIQLVGIVRDRYRNK